ncbi:MAG: hypothetical protein KKE02_22175 [Alphaproteobacteria bacterium]|nr:hypothetical protein [Alphaproteobacteria bacterium]MBU1516052.1 hypothetical protein [Alphaproteobacteria bacterium]MBU2092733.1 hypothetical protein [Alphaproteobacteria bacterium]MBU2153742.1 hypothetical protein [Alphaproteobacteria bacterium]MBU2308370.1 hypothetical protein [Alphaproteobacteria bacterium]
MSIRRTFLLLIAPLFLLLAGVNGALLYLWERAEAERGLAGQAIAAAVTTAAFAGASDDLAHALADPVRAAALRDAALRVEGLHGLYIVTPDGETVQIAGRPSAFWPGAFDQPRAPLAAPIRSDPSGKRMASGLAPVKGGGYVIAQIDADPLFAQVMGLQRLVIALVIAAGLIGLVLALVIARVIVRELARNSATIEAIRADTPIRDDDRFAIRETHDLALAVRLMRASVTGRLTRGRHELARRDRERDEAGSVAAYRETAFPPLSVTVAGASLAVRMLGAASAGSFYALCEGPGGATLVLGESAAETPSAALARAMAARRFFETTADEAVETRVARGKAAFDLTRVAWLTWSATQPPSAPVLALLDGDNAARAAAYVARAEGLDPALVIDDLATLLGASGVVAVARPASAQAGDR